MIFLRVKACDGSPEGMIGVTWMVALERIMEMLVHKRINMENSTMKNQTNTEIHKGCKCESQCGISYEEDFTYSKITFYIYFILTLLLL